MCTQLPSEASDGAKRVDAPVSLSVHGSVARGRINILYTLEHNDID